MPMWCIFSAVFWLLRAKIRRKYVKRDILHKKHGRDLLPFIFSFSSSSLPQAFTKKNEFSFVFRSINRNFASIIANSSVYEDITYKRLASWPYVIQL